MDAKLSKDIVVCLAEKVKDWKADKVVGVESRGFLFGMMLANELNIPFVPIRKKGKLPYNTVGISYDLEYGKASIEMHADAIKKGERILVHDDLLATGGTADAATRLVIAEGGEIAGFCFLANLSFLKGSDILAKYADNSFSLATY
ncbi:UNVERIFIED_CONTAM: hypothetical protein GTU68_038831 [Idotea baltica]|nr:hypothetical protein [Idotea baltica]